jgi:hypothetical protein
VIARGENFRLCVCEAVVLKRLFYTHDCSLIATGIARAGNKRSHTFAGCLVGGKLRRIEGQDGYCDIDQRKDDCDANNNKLN